LLFNEPSQPAVCVSGTVPASCATPSPTFHCDFPPAQCYDKYTLMAGYSQSSNQLCGYELAHCANGCVTEQLGADCQ
jgi:hypothetical protein